MLKFKKFFTAPVKSRFTALECSLAAALVLSVFLGAYTHGVQKDLAGKMIRLHVIANSNSTEDQAVKLKVRDSVLTKAQELIGDEKEIAGVYNRLYNGLGELEQTAEEELSSLGSRDPVKTELKRAYFPTRVYDGFSLPAGNYQTLNVTIGSGAGRNWWCVVFPPLCLTAAEDFDEAAQAANLTPDEVGLITEDGTGYRIKFKLVELFVSLFEKR